MDQSGSVTRWLRSLEHGDQAAASALWDRYFQSLVGVARVQLRGMRTGAGDEDDVALSAFTSFFRRVERGQFDELRGREDLWRVLVVIARRKAISWIRHETAQKRGGGKLLGDAYLEDVVNAEPTPEFTAELLDEMRHLLEFLRKEDGTLLLIAMRKLEGCNNAEIAAELSVSTRTVERKFRRICILWSNDVEQRMGGGGVRC